MQANEIHMFIITTSLSFSIIGLLCIVAAHSFMLLSHKTANSQILIMSQAARTGYAFVHAHPLKTHEAG